MRKQALLITTLFAFAAACSSTNAPPTPKSNNNNMTSDAGTSALDAGVVVDAGPSTEQTICGAVTPGTMDTCCPVDGKGCGMQTCFYTTGAINDPQCRDVASMTVGAEETCDSNLNNCAAGYTCAQIDAQIGPICMKVCRAGTNPDCASEQDPMGNPYSCLFTFQENNAWGLCLPTPTECVPFNDMCPMGEHCEVISNQGQKGCIPDGTQQIGQPCGAMQGCQRGGICVNQKCEIPCDHTNPMSCTDPEQTCSGELGFSDGTTLGFGICGKSACNPATSATDCGMGENCEITGTKFECVPAGTAMAGASCVRGMTFCAQGNICINNLQMGMGDQCYEVCNTMDNMCSSGTCRQLMDQSGNPVGGVGGWGVCL